MLISARTLREGYKIPRWYGFAYFEPAMAHYVCYPIPFHWLIRWGRQIWWAFLVPRKKLAEERKWEAALEREFTFGYKQGREAERQHLAELARSLGVDALSATWLAKE